MKITRFATTLAALSLSLMAHAQATYRLIDLTPNGSNATAMGVSASQAVGSLLPVGGNPALASHAALFSLSGSALDLHPTFLDSPLGPGRSTVLAQADGYQAGYGSGISTAGRQVALLWSGSSMSATVLPVPIDNYGYQATAIGGGQIVGRAQSISTKREVVQFGPTHALLWDIASGTVTDLHPGGNGTVALGVGGGKQVGYEIKSQSSAVMWSGTARSMVSLHPPRGFDVSQASATDGIQQVGFGGMDVQIFVEKRGRRVRFNYAMLWLGTAASFQTLDSTGFRDTYATGVANGSICGYGAIGVPTGAISGYHALVWSGPNHSLTDLHQFLPVEFTSSTATGIDGEGNISGTITTATGERHAVLWVPTL